MRVMITLIIVTSFFFLFSPRILPLNSTPLFSHQSTSCFFLTFLFLLKPTLSLSPSVVFPVDFEYILIQSHTLQFHPSPFHFHFPPSLLHVLSHFCNFFNSHIFCPITLLNQTHHYQPLYFFLHLPTLFTLRLYLFTKPLSHKLFLFGLDPIRFQIQNVDDGIQ